MPKGNAMLHNPEPYYAVGQPDGTTMILCGGEQKEVAPGLIAGKRSIIVARGLKRADAERLVACANSMAGIPACDLPKVRALWEHHKSIPMLPPGFHAITPEAQKQLREICGPAGSMPPLPISAALDDKVTRATGGEG